MKNVVCRPVVLSFVLMIASFTQPAAALPRFSYSDTYYAADYDSNTGTYCISFENGHDNLSCSGAHDRGGTLDGIFRYTYEYECSSGTVYIDQWYFYSRYCGSWTPIPRNPSCKIDNEC